MRRSRCSTPLLATTRPLTFCQLNEAAVGGALAGMVPIECKEYLRPFKKTLQRLNLPKDYPKERKLICTRKNLNILGDHINMFLLYYCKSWELKHWKKMLWRFVSLFSTLDEKQLYKLYRYSKTDQFTKFLKVYCRLEYADMANLPSNKKWAKLRDRWRLASCGVKMQEGYLHSLPESWDFPEGNVPTERCSTTQEKEVMEQHCATCDVFDALSVTTNEETASSPSSNVY
ncbi:CHD1 helical C-terminal domain containing protein 1 isoform X2 [Pantherophis guttatus]|uniref:CHD1 helical C-terminal domain containing protein 1 isoform X2 n=1 Tax=Pantherophis guttatus TaxID=94885 RepID=A0ABM3ZLL0_PANGU|nr:CHD1 helical C-terminal domain containing protein 1 isoform X2 [Pantherophis guttatus]